MYSIGEMLIQLKNAQTARHERALIPFSKIKFEIAKVLEKNDFIQSVETKKKKVQKSEFKYLDIKLKYNNNEGAISHVSLISKPSRRMYLKKTDIKPVRSGFGILIISTPKGIMSGEEARKQGLGGEVIAKIW